jgi:hypothetical protein
MGPFIRSEIQNVDQVHTVTGQGIHRLTLTPGKYEIYVDPGGPYINVKVVPSQVSGASGRVSLAGVSGNLSASPVLGPLLGIGIFVPAARFAVKEEGTYDLSLRPM